MREQSGGSFPVQSARIGSNELGPATIVVDDETVTILAASALERPIRARVANVETLRISGDELTMETRRGSSVAIRGASVARVRAAILASCRALPEVTRALRALGSRRGHRSQRATAGDEQHRFFAPLLLARRTASGALTPNDTIAAFDASQLTIAFEMVAQRFAEQRFAANPPARRALEAELVDLTEPLRDALGALAAAAADASADVDDLSRWRAWAARLRATFEVADRVWIALDVALDDHPPSIDDAASQSRPRARAPTPPRPFRRRS